MKLRAFAASIAFLTLEQKHAIGVPVNGSWPATLAAQSIERGVEYPTVVRLTGNAEIRMRVCLPVGQDGKPTCDGYMIVRADEAQFHEDTGQIEARGNVVVTPLSHEPRR